MSRTTKILTVSMPPELIKTMDAFVQETGQTKSEFIRNALWDYIVENEEERKRFLEAFKATRKERKKTLTQIKKEYQL